MIRLHVTAEGQTELSFVRAVLAPHLAKWGIFADARCVLTSRDNRVSREYRGGLLSYVKAKKDIISWLKEDNHSECRFTTMFDLYALPEDFPGYNRAVGISDRYERVRFLEDAMSKDIRDNRFVPYIQLHEFEAMILSDPQKLDWEYLDHEEAIENLVALGKDKNPELINDGVMTAPSKRIIKEIPEYDKVSAGVSVVQRIGLDTLRCRCMHLGEWLLKLEGLKEDFTCQESSERT
ncbi:protein of unknown function [Dethiosulfovibrio salsuginis]|uniref:DUF4276 family protein n=1 Tax=Dethiosulfovibrio salsuginis TaxID=561720 RepID=A0A1X7KCL9_9BACT|nr:protein of unknown function [Dethiosulfovibrio salsuginis]